MEHGHSFRAIAVITAVVGGLAIAVTPAASASSGSPIGRSASAQHIVSHSVSVTYGVDVNQFDGDIGPQRLGNVLQVIETSGATNVRLALGGGWQAIEANGPTDNWSSFDGNLATAYSDHLSVLLEMGNEPSWDAAGGNVNAPPRDCYGWSQSSPSSWCSSVATWVADLVSHLMSTAIPGSSPPAAEITDVAGLIPRNEPQNYAMNWVDPASGGPSQWALDYAHFQQTVYITAHSTVAGFDQKNGASYSIIVMNGGEELAPPQNRIYSRPFETGPDTYSQNAGMILETLFATPAFCTSMDTFDFHVGDHGPLWSVKMVDDSEIALENCDGGKHLPIWVSEVGYTSIPQVQSLPEYAAELGGAYQGGQLGQARYLYDTMEALASDPNVVGVNWTFAIDPNTSNIAIGGQLHGLHNSGAGAGFDASNPDSFYVSKSALSAFEAVDGHGGAVPPVPTPQSSTPAASTTAPTLFDSVACPSTSSCVAVGSPGAVLTSADGGTSWTGQQGVPSVGALYGVACSTSQHCVAVGYSPSGGAIETTADGGATWTPTSVPTGIAALDSVSCASTTCVGVGETMSGGAIVVSDDSGSTWSSATVPSSVVDLASVSCSSASSCMAVGDGSGSDTAVALATVDGGHTWNQDILPSGGQFLASVSCISSECMAVGGAPSGAPWAVATSDGGATWTPLAIPAAASTLYSISCGTATTCVAAGDASATAGFLTTSDGGKTWSAVASSGMSAVMGVACSGSNCIAVGTGATSVNTSADGGATWIGRSPGTQIQEYLATSCATTSTCVAVGDTITGGFASTSSNGGQSWTAPNAITGAADLFSVACPTSTVCYAAGDTSTSAAVYVSNDAGTTWKQTQALPTNLVSVSAVDCVSASTCVAVGDVTSGQFLAGSASYTTNGGATWNVSQLPNDIFDLESVSCASATSCAAVGDGGSATSTAAVAVHSSDGGATWISGSVPAGASVFYAVSCTTSNFCMAGGEEFGSTSVIATSSDAGMRWSLTSSVPEMSAGMALSCSSSSDCWVSGAGDDPVALTSDAGASWSPVDSPAGTYNLAAIACPATGQCIVAGGTLAAQVTGSSGNPPPPTSGPGYWMEDSAGQVFNFGTAQNYGSASGGGSWVAMAGTPDGGGYWLISSKGVIEDFGDAGSYVPSPEIYGVSPPVSIASTPDGKGFWVASANGQVLTAGDATYFGSPAQSGLKLKASIVNMVPTPDGRGYWLLGGDGGVFTYGDATYYGSTGNIKLVAPAVAMTPTSDGRGYWFVAGDGGVFTFGDATYFGSMGGKRLNKPIDGIVVTSDGRGYWMVASDGGVFTFGDAVFAGSLGSNPPSTAIVAFSPA